MRKYECEVLFRPTNDDLAFLPEGPIACGENRFSWVAIQHGAESGFGSLNIFDLETGENISHPLEGRPGFAFPTETPNQFIVGAERRIGLFNTQSSSWTTLCDSVDANVDNTIINDGVAFSGGLIFGTKDLEFAEKKAGLYFWRERDAQLIQLRSDQICSNGKVIFAESDRVRFLDIDTPTKNVVEYSLDLETGEVSEPRLVLELSKEVGFPDGMVATPDDESVIIAFYNPEDVTHGEARQFRLADGELEAVWETPSSPQVTCPLLIEHEGSKKLILTTAVEHMSGERRQTSMNAGCLFIGDTPFV